ncbi:MAG: hypothetical protein LHV69_04625 [Elusimicrobia bacterium]|nr:hypothetical protein [Candidatus Obscuribacterium magneticum]
MWFKIIGEINDLRTIAVGGSIRELPRLRKIYGPGRWRKLKGIAVVELPDGELCRAEIHWYEAHGIGKREFKIKKIMEK